MRWCGKMSSMCCEDLHDRISKVKQRTITIASPIRCSLNCGKGIVHRSAVGNGTLRQSRTGDVQCLSRSWSYMLDNLSFV